MFKPFTDNIIFYDTEFSSLNPYVGEILSVGMVKMSGEEFYCEIEYEGEYSDWVKENLLDTLNEKKLSRSEAVKQIHEFVGRDKPYIMAYVNQFDVVFSTKLYGIEYSPFEWIPLDFASVLFGLGYNPEIFHEDDYTKLANKLGVDIKQGHTHNALDDAKFLREVYLALVAKN